VLFSATYPDSVQDSIEEIVTEAQQIAIKKESLQLDHIQQFYYRCDPKKKPEFIMDVFNTCCMTQTIIFMNTKSFAEKLHIMMRKNGYKSTIIFGDMSPVERDEMVNKFRNGEVSVIITTNMLARGLDVPEVEIVINFDVPTKKDLQENRHGDCETYLHRIGRTGRFGSKGLAISIYDRDEDKKYLDEIIDHFAMQTKIKELKGHEELKTLLEEIRQI
jgi:ATP-dependent RNA helicase DDX19/DBP5